MFSLSIVVVRNLKREVIGARINFNYKESLLYTLKYWWIARCRHSFERVLYRLRIVEPIGVVQTGSKNVKNDTLFHCVVYLYI